MTRHLVESICQACIDVYRAQRSISLDVLQAVPGIANLLARRESGDLHLAQPSSEDNAALVTSLAAAHRAQASESRLGHKAAPFKQPLNPNLTKAMTLVAERRTKKKEASIMDKKAGPKISVTLWTSLGESHLFKMEKIGQVTISKVFFFTKSLREAFDELLLQARNELQTLCPQSHEIDWGNTKAIAHESMTKSSSIHTNHRGSGTTVQDLYDEFVKERRGSKAALNDNLLEVRFVFAKSLLVSEKMAGSGDDLLDDEESESARYPTATSKRRRQSSVLPKTSAPITSLRSRYSTPSLKSQASGPGSMRGGRPFIPLRSAFKPPPPTYCRDPPMASYQFKRTIASFQEDGSVVFETQENIEVIEIAKDWCDGEKACAAKQPYHETGYVGKGSSKYGIYARFQGKEYVMAQIIDEDLSDDDAQRQLRAEYKILCRCDGFKQWFDELARKLGAVVPAFYFNFKTSILGELIVDREDPRYVRHVHFIATLLLPCGPADSQVQKFTGNDEVGPATDDITKAIHAFAHFSLIYSYEHLVFCDLQGTYDARRTMCLIDPQIHTTDPKDKRLYWDGGPTHIAKFKQEHLRACDDNWVCQRLRLQEIVLVDDGSEAPPAPSPPRGKKKAKTDKHGLRYILD
ncbi:hypothetical protein AX14_001999 [Amanita brunnescens Koide BX004]|nr:hypothetical protein AX14_001999 [Amanita brunnescens Koide BX004]